MANGGSRRTRRCNGNKDGVKLAAKETILTERQAGLVGSAIDATPETFAGGATSGNVALKIRSYADALVMYYTPVLSPDNRIYMALLRSVIGDSTILRPGVPIPSTEFQNGFLDSSGSGVDDTGKAGMIFEVSGSTAHEGA